MCKAGIIKKNLSKLLIGIGVAAFVAAGSMSPAYAVPTLQLDSDGAPFYDVNEQTIVTEDSTFSVFAIGTPSGSGGDGTDPTPSFNSKSDFLGVEFFLSIAVIPKLGEFEGGSFGSFDISWGGGSETVNVTGDMVWGIPPAALLDPDSLGPHGIFKTFFYELAFMFDATDMIATYNTQCRFFDTTIDPDCEAAAALIYPPTPIPTHPDAGGESLFHEFVVDASNLDPSIGIHFDLYFDQSTLQEFAPYSHDAEYRPPCDAPPGASCGPPRIPEPGTMLMFAFGLLSMAFIRRRIACRV